MPIENFMLAGPAGRIECLLKSPDAGPPFPAAALVCHPHPLFGGTMHNKVTHAAARAIVSAGLPALRFNFRGAGLSEGRHGAGHAEQDDVRLLLADLAGRYPGLPLLVCGYSFGAFVGLKAGCSDPRVTGLVGIGLPVSLYDFSFLGGCRDRSLTIIQGTADPFGPLPMVMALAAALPGGARVLPVAGAAHNFEGKLEELALHVKEAVDQAGPARPPA